MDQITVILVVIGLGVTVAWLAGSRFDARNARQPPKPAPAPGSSAAPGFDTAHADVRLVHPSLYPRVVTVGRVTESRLPVQRRQVGPSRQTPQPTEAPAPLLVGGDDSAAHRVG